MKRYDKCKGNAKNNIIINGMMNVCEPKCVMNLKNKIILFGVVLNKYSSISRDFSNK